MKEHSEKDFGNASPSLVRSIVQRIEGGTCTLSKPISSPVPQPSRCHPEDLLNHTAKESAVAVVTQKRTPYTLTNRNSAADTLRNGSHSVTDPGSVNMKVRGSNEQSNCRRLSLRDKTMSESNSLEKKFRSTESLLNSRPTGQSNASRPASAANSRTQDNVSARSDRTTDPKESEHRSDSSRTGTGVTFRSRSRSIDDSSSSGQEPRSRSVEARSRTLLRSSVNADSGPTPSASRASCAPVPAAVVCDAAPGKQMVVLSRTVAKRQSLTTPMTAESSSTAPDRKGLQQKLSSGRLGITVDKLLPNYQPKRKLQSSVSVDANVVDYGVEAGDLRRSSSLHESAAMPLLMVTFEDYPEPPPPEEDLNAKMELLFEEYRKIELGLILKKVNREEEEQEHKVSEKRLPVERGRRMASTDRFSRAASPAQNPRVRSISLDRSLLPESRTSKKETSNTMPTRSDPVQSAVRDSRTRTKTPGLNQDNSRTRAVSATRLSNTRPSSSNARATAPVCPSNLTKSVIAQTPASSMSAKTLEDHRNHKNKSSDNLNRLPHTCNQNGKHNIQNSSYEPMIPKRDTSVTRNPRRNSATDLSSRTIEDRSGTIANGNARCSLDTSSCNVTNKHFAPTTVSQHTSIDVPPKNSLGNRRTTHPDINTAAVRKPTESATGSGKLDLRNGNNGKSDPAKVVPMADLEMSVKHGAEETRKTPLTKATGTDERLCSRSKIPVPIYSKKFNSSSQRSLKRCDSGVDIANNFKPEGDCAGLRIGQDKESKSKTPLILDPVSSHLIYNGRAATKTSPNNIDDDYY